MVNFNALVQRQTEACFNLLGSTPCMYTYNGVNIPTRVIIDRDVEISIDGGLSFMRRTVLSLYKPDIHTAHIRATVATDTETFVIGGFVSDDDQIAQVYVT